MIENKKYEEKRPILLIKWYKAFLLVKIIYASYYSFEKKNSSSRTKLLKLKTEYIIVIDGYYIIEALKKKGPKNKEFLHGYQL